MHAHIQHTNTIKPAHRRWVGWTLLLSLIVIGIGLGLLVDRSRLSRVGSTGMVAPYASISVAPVDPGQIAALVQQHEVQRARLGASVAPVASGQIAALVRQHEAQRARLGVSVAPVASGQIAALMRQHEAQRARLGVSVAPVDLAQIVARLGLHY